MAEQSLEIKDFSGGMTDNFIGAALNKYEQADNMVLRQDSKLESRKGSKVLDPVCYQIPFVSVPKRVDSIFKHRLERLYQTMGKIYRASGTWAEILGPEGFSAFPAGVGEFNQNSWAEWNNHVIVTNDLRTKPVVIFRNSGTWNLRQLGLRKVTPAEVTAIGTSASGANSRAYAFAWAYTYTIDGVEFIMRSAVSNSKPYTGAVPTNTLTSLPVLANAANEHYDEVNLKLEIYRTANTASVFYKVGEVSNGTTTFADAVSDAALQQNELSYLEQGDLDYDQPPDCKFIIQHQGVVYFLNIKDSLGDTYPNRVVQANPDQISAAPESNSVDVDGELTGGGVANQYPVVFTKDKTYRLQGFYDSTGNGGIQAIEIAGTVGCVSHASVVKTPQGIFWAARDGFYFTDGYQVQRISEEIPSTFAGIVSTEAQAKRITGAYNSFEKTIYWTASSAPSLDDNDLIFTANLFFGIKPDVPFLRWSGGLWASNFQPSCLWFDVEMGQLIRGDARGYLLVQSPESLNDIKIDEAVVPSLWTGLPVVYDFRSTAMDFGSATARKWGTKLVVYADSIGKVTMMPYSNNDNTGVFTEMTEIRSNSPILWGDTEVRWGDESLRWNYVPIVSGVRRFPQRSIRFSYKQVRLTNSYTLIQSSVSLGQAVFNGASNTATLINPTSLWDDNAVDYKISSSFDNYLTEFNIVQRTDTVLTVSDISNTFPGGTFDFKVRGYRKNEAIRLLSLAIIYQFMTPSQTPFRETSA